MAPFPLTITEVIKPSTNGEKSGDQVQLWVDAEEMSGVRATDAFRELAGREAVFLVVITEGEAYPDGYALYAAVSYWTITDERVTGGMDGIRLENAPYSELVEKVHAAVTEATPTVNFTFVALQVTILVLAAGFAPWVWRDA